jgi:hypothetical protein
MSTTTIIYYSTTNSHLYIIILQPKTISSSLSVLKEITLSQGLSNVLTSFDGIQKELAQVY